MTKSLLILPLLLAGIQPLHSAEPVKPNIIIIFTDDHGYTDLGIHGIDANVKTPVLDSLAAGGALMKNGYSTAPQCVPSRAGIISGRIQNTFGTHGNGQAVPVPLSVPTIAERLKKLGGYKTGMVGKWHLSPPATADAKDYPGNKSSYEPGKRGFDEYWNGAYRNYSANFDLKGRTIPHQRINDPRNRVIVQGEAAEAFIERNKETPFFLYLALYGPHTPLIQKTDPYYKNFPKLDYPHFNDEMDDIRRQGLALVQAIDDSVGGVMAKLREHGLEENTIILFSGDNGAQPKYWNSLASKATISKWDGSENVPLRGEKGSLWEGGIKVPMFVYWKGRIGGNQVIEDPVTTLDFTATTLALAGGSIPPEMTGTNLLPRLTGEAGKLSRKAPLFWNWGSELSMRDGDWKIHRIGKHLSLFNLAEDPNELYDLKRTTPERFAKMQTQMTAWFDGLPEEGRSALRNKPADLYRKGAPEGTPVDPRFFPSGEGKPAPYPAQLITK